MSSYTAQQGSYGTLGWQPANARTPAPMREGSFLPLSYVSPTIAGVQLGVMTTSPIWF